MGNLTPEEAEHRQLEDESIVEAARDRKMFERDKPDDDNAWKMLYNGDPYWRWGDYELDLGPGFTPVETDFDHFEAVMAGGDESLGRDEKAEESSIGVDIPEYLEWNYMEVT